MKELYLNAEMDVVKFAACDVITTSGGQGGNDNPGTSSDWVTRDNEGAPDYDAFTNQ